MCICPKHFLNMFKLKSKYSATGDQPKAIKKLIEGLGKGCPYQTLLGVTGSGKTFTMASVIEHFQMPVLVMAPNKTLAAQLYYEYRKFFPENSVNYFVSYYDYYQPEAYIPNTDTYIEKEAMINDEIDRLRHQATGALLSRKDVIIVASVSCIYNLGVPNEYWEAAIHLEKGKPMTRGDLVKQLVQIQFTRNDTAPKRGQFRVRGDIFEILLAGSDLIYRVDLSGQKIKEILIIDPVTRKWREKVNEVLVFAPQHFIYNKPKIKKAIANIKDELKERLAYFEKNNYYLEAERLRRRTWYDIEMLGSLGYCHGVENYSRHLSGKLAGEAPDSLLSYFPYKDGRPRFLTIIDESHLTVPQVGGMYEGDRARKETLIKYGWRLPSALDNRPLRFSEFTERIGQTIFTSATPGSWEKQKSFQTVEQVIRPTGLADPPIEVRPVFDKKNNKSQVDDLIEEIEELVPQNKRVIANTLTKKMAEDLYNYLLDKGYKVNYIHSEVKTLVRSETIIKFRKGEYDVLIGVNLLREGLDMPEVTLVAIMDADREGFLRSETSLIQTMGRAARNIDGKVILYADEITGSMRRAIEEVERRREKQLAYNRKHGIEAKSIEKEVENLIGD